MKCRYFCMVGAGLLLITGVVWAESPLNSSVQDSIQDSAEEYVEADQDLPVVASDRIDDTYQAPHTSDSAINKGDTIADTGSSELFQGYRGCPLRDVVKVKDYVETARRHFPKSTIKRIADFTGNLRYQYKCGSHGCGDFSRGVLIEGGKFLTTTRCMAYAICRKKDINHFLRNTDLMLYDDYEGKTRSYKIHSILECGDPDRCGPAYTGGNVDYMIVSIEKKDGAYPREPYGGAVLNPDATAIRAGDPIVVVSSDDGHSQKVDTGLIQFERNSLLYYSDPEIISDQGEGDGIFNIEGELVGLNMTWNRRNDYSCPLNWAIRISDLFLISKELRRAFTHTSGEYVNGLPRYDLGIPVWLSWLSRSIPDAESNKVGYALFDVPRKNRRISNVHIRTNIYHPLHTDLRVFLMKVTHKSFFAWLKLVLYNDPSGYSGPETVLFDQESGAGFLDVNADTTYFSNRISHGEWLLKVKDLYKGNIGQLYNARMYYTKKPSCESDFCTESTGKSIPDSDSIGIQRHIMVDQIYKNAGLVEVKVEIDHTYHGDIKVILESPAGTKAVVRDLTQSNASGRLAINKILSSFQNENRSGLWTLHVYDMLPRDTGSLQSWSLRFR